MVSRRIAHALSFDIEDWFHLVEVQATADPAGWPRFESIVMQRTEQILETLSEYNVRATFFVLGWVAERYPQLVPLIASGGHEIGTHSFWHRKVFGLSPAAFRDDLQRSIDLLGEQSGHAIRGFRAPSFSITPGTEWAFDVMKDLGIEYDASLFPANRAHGGYPCALVPHTRVTPSRGTLVELPMSVVVFGPLRFCFSGGGYFRLLPSWLIEQCFEFLESDRRPAVVYLHPRDFATDCPRVAMPVYRRFKCYVGLGTTRRKFHRLLARFRFDTCYRVLCQQGLFGQQTSCWPETVAGVPG